MGGGHVNGCHSFFLFLQNANRFVWQNHQKLLTLQPTMGTQVSHLRQLQVRHLRTRAKQ